MTGTNLKRVATTEESVNNAPAQPAYQAESFTAGGTVGELHQRLQQELGMDWDDPIVYAPGDTAISHRVERKFSAAMGIAALGAGYAAVAALIF